MEENMNSIYVFLSEKGLTVLAALAIFLIGKWVVNLMTNAVERVLNKRNVDPTLTSFAKGLIYGIGIIFVSLAALSKLGIQTASFIAVLGAAGLAIGMALQGSLSNFAAGVMIIIFRPYKTGDAITAGGVSGSVKEVQIFNTILSTPDNVKVILPNAHALSGSVTNYSANDMRRVDLKAGISYADDIQKAKKVLEDILKNHSLVLKEPAPLVAVHELGDSSVNFVVRPWVKSTDYWVAYFDLTEKMKLELEKNGITIPFPQRDVHHYGLAAQYQETTTSDTARV